MTILLVDDHTLYRQSLARALGEHDPSFVIFETGEPQAAMKLLEDNPTDLVLLDMNLGYSSGLDLLADIRRIAPSMKVVIVSMHKVVYLVGEAIKAGVQGYVTKDAPLDQLLQAIQVVGQGGTWFSHEITVLLGQLLRKDQTGGSKADSQDEFIEFSNLTRREQEIFSVLANGKTIEEAAKKLGLSGRTVENHRGRIYQKLGLADRHELINYARRLGLVF